MGELRQRMLEIAPYEDTPTSLKIAGAVSIASWFAVLYFFRMLPFIGNAFYRPLTARLITSIGISCARTPKSVPRVRSFSPRPCIFPRLGVRNTRECRPMMRRSDGTIVALATACPCCSRLQPQCAAPSVDAPLRRRRTAPG